MARYIAGFSPEARKSGPFCRPPAIKPGGRSLQIQVEELKFFSARQFGTKFGVEVAILHETETVVGSGLTTSKTPPNWPGGVVPWSF